MRLRDHKKKLASAGAAIAMAGGGAVAADEAADPYQEVPGQEVRRMAIEDNTPQSGTSSVRVSENRPEAQLRKWSGEANMGVRVRGVNGQGERGWFSGALTYGSGAKQARMRPVENGYKIDVVLNQEPRSNEVSFALENTENLDFYYQPPLDEANPDQTCTPTHCFEERNGQMATTTHRPENVVGSYAVYHKSKKNHVEGQTNYATGKAYHIYRPKIIDDAGNETWGELRYENGELTVTVPDRFLSEAVYPVVVDPTFGYDTLGGTSLNSNSAGSDGLLVRYSTPTGSLNGTLDSISAAFSIEDGGSPQNNRHWFFYVNEVDSEGTDSHGEVAKYSDAFDLDTTGQFYTLNAANSESLDGSNYIINFHPGDVAVSDTSQEVVYADDTGGVDRWSEVFSPPRAAQEKPWTDSISTDQLEVSVYATYDPSLDVDTQAVTNITSTSGDGNGETFGSNATERGFVYNTSSHATPTAPITDLGTTTDSFESVSDGSTDLSSSNWRQATISTDGGDWQGNSGGTGSGGTGPSSAQDGTQYIYTESSSNESCEGSSNTTCIVEFSLQANTTKGTIDYHYHMNGGDLGSSTLALDAYNGSTWSQLWSVSGDQGTSWINNTVSWNHVNYTELRFVRSNVTGFEADVALDNISVHEESVGENSPANSDYSFVENETGTFSPSTFSLTLSGLSADTQYFVRAYASSTADGYVYGDEVNFTTNADTGEEPTPVQSEYWF